MVTCRQIGSVGVDAVGVAEGLPAVFLTSGSSLATLGRRTTAATRKTLLWGGNNVVEKKQPGGDVTQTNRDKVFTDASHHIT